MVYDHPFYHIDKLLQKPNSLHTYWWGYRSKPILLKLIYIIQSNKILCIYTEGKGITTPCITIKGEPLHCVAIPSRQMRLFRNLEDKVLGVTCLLPKLPSRPIKHSSISQAGSTVWIYSFRAIWNAPSSTEPAVNKLQKKINYTNINE